jgi:hypothetical protein
MATRARRFHSLQRCRRAAVSCKPLTWRMQTVLSAALLFMMLFAASAAPPPVGELANVVTDGGSFELTLVSTPQPIPLNELFELAVEVRAIRKLDDPNPVWLDVLATMPAHKHGMNTLPRVEDLGDGRFLVRGVLFHMAGEWELEFDVVKGRIHEHAVARIKLE